MIAAMYMSSADLGLLSIQFRMVDGYTEDHKKTKLKIGGWALARGWVLTQTMVARIV